MSDELASSPEFEVISGAYYADHWTGRSVDLRLKPSPLPRTLQIRLWNPPYNPRYMENNLVLSLNGVSLLSKPMGPGRGETVDVKLPAGSASALRLASKAYLEPDVFDPRTRGVIMRLVFS